MQPEWAELSRDFSNSLKAANLSANTHRIYTGVAEAHASSQTEAFDVAWR